MRVFLTELPADLLRAVLALLSADTLALVSQCSRGLETAAHSDDLWAPLYRTLPKWRQCGQQLPSQPNGGWPTFHALHRAARSRCARCTHGGDGPSDRPWQIGRASLDRARARANCALQQCVPELRAYVASHASSNSFLVVAWLTRHSSDDCPRGVGARFWVRPADNCISKESLNECLMLPRAASAPTGWTGLDEHLHRSGPAPTMPDDDKPQRQLASHRWPSLELQGSQWAIFETWAVRVLEQQGPSPLPPRNVGPLSSQFAAKVRASALAFAEILIPGQCVFCFLFDRELVSSSSLRRVDCQVAHLPTGSSYQHMVLD